jgi:hypothetical protein
VPEGIIRTFRSVGRQYGHFDPKLPDRR